MATEMKLFKKFPRELRDNVWRDALIPGPGVHFIKPNTDYNGTFLGPAAENAGYVHGPGIADISSFSAACEHARISMASPEGKEAVEYMIRKHGMTRIVLNPGMTSATANPNEYTNLPIDTSQWGSIIVDKINDIFVFSTFRSGHFPNDSFSGGIISAHADFRGIKILGVSMPQCNREDDDYRCKDCGEDFTDEPHMFMEQVEFCSDCMASWNAGLQDVERVYLIVPGARRSQAGDEVEVYRFGEQSAMSAAADAMPEKPSFFRINGPDALPALGTRPAMTLEGTNTIETLGSESPHCFHGSAFTLFEAPRDELPEIAIEIMEFMFEATYEMRRDFAREDEDYSPFPRRPSHCGGLIEFRFLSF